MKSLFIFFTLILLFSCSSVNQNEDIPLEKDDSELKTASPYSNYGIEMMLGKFDPESHNDYLEIDTIHADRPGLYLHKDTYAAFIEMYNAAKKDGITLQIRSATRNFDVQKSIWEAKWNGSRKVDGEDISKTIPDKKSRALKILEYSSMPSTSRHHWGSDIDLNNFNNEWFETGEGRKIWDWLEKNAIDYGFCRPYTAKDEKRPDGYFEERWHWSYLPLANHFMKLAKEQHKDSLIQGFLGSEVAKDILVVDKYIFGINLECLD